MDNHNNSIGNYRRSNKNNKYAAKFSTITTMQFSPKAKYHSENKSKGNNNNKVNDTLLSQHILFLDVVSNNNNENKDMSNINNKGDNADNNADNTINNTDKDINTCNINTNNTNNNKINTNNNTNNKINKINSNASPILTFKSKHQPQLSSPILL